MDKRNNILLTVLFLIVFLSNFFLVGCSSQKEQDPSINTPSLPIPNENNANTDYAF